TPAASRRRRWWRAPIHMVGRASDFGVDVGPATVDMKRVKARKDAIAGQSRTGVETWLETMERCTVLPEAEAHSLPRSRADRERGGSQCGLADARRAEDEEILAVLEAVAGGEVLVEPLELGGRLLPEAEAKRRTSRPRSDAMCPWPEIGR